MDSDTASAAEIVAGALKENGRATLVGQTTFGKGSIQCIVPLKSIQSGIQVTIARFLSPSHVSYDGRGVAPDRFVDRVGLEKDLQLFSAFQVADQLIKLLPR